jgi:hypothetical protein
MPDPNKFNIMDALIPLLGGAAAAYSPRYLGAGVNAAAGLYGQRMNQKYDQQRLSIEQAFRDKMLEEQKGQTEQARIHNELEKQTTDEETQTKRDLAGKVADAFVANRTPGAVGPPTESDSYTAGALRGGMPTSQISDIVPAPPKPTTQEDTGYPFAAGGGGTYDKRTGKWSERPAGRAGAAGGKPTSVEGQIIQLDREIRQISEALKFADPEQEAEYQSQLEDAMAARDALKAQRPATPGGGSNPNPTVQVNIPGVHTDAGKRLAAKYLGK